jgi:hypothetical protein
VAQQVGLIAKTLEASLHRFGGSVFKKTALQIDP